MAAEKPRATMTDDQYRGLLTEREREILSGEADVSENYRYRVVSRIRTKLDALAEDVELLREHRHDLHAELVSTVYGPYLCPRCDEAFDYPWDVHNHAYGRQDKQHDGYEKNEAPAWWPDEPREE